MPNGINTVEVSHSLASQPYFSACACALERGRGRGRKNASGDYSTVFVSPAGICGGPMTLQQSCDIAERYVNKVMGERNDGYQTRLWYSGANSSSYI